VPISRRELLRNSALTGAGIAIAGGFGPIFGSSIAGAQGKGGGSAGYGALVPDPDGLLDLPPGFHYKVVYRAQAWSTIGGTPSTLSTGEVAPNAPDGTGAFLGPNFGTILLQNKELSAGDQGPVPHTVPTYDPGAAGGTTNLVIDFRGNLVKHYASLAGTIRNCAGGVTPWGTWLTCEENDSTNAATGIRHGYVFEVDPWGHRTEAVPLVALGRFEHEAASVDPRTGTVYLSEDASSPNGLLYKFVPSKTSGRYGSLQAGGTLYAMKAGDLLDLSQVTKAGASYPVTWVPVPTPDPDIAGGQPKIRTQLTDQVTRSKKFEGLWWGRGQLYINCSYAKTAADVSNIGTPHEGQVWTYDPRQERIALHIRFEPGGLFDGPDNITVSPHGGAFLCEDGDGDQYVIYLDDENRAFAFAKNRIAFDGGFQEFTGATFSRDGRFLFVNTQQPGITYAIKGPWAKG
jgi:secreted PhoX family phosphatase